MKLAFGFQIDNILVFQLQKEALLLTCLKNMVEF